MSQLKWDTLALYLAYRDPRTPRRARFVIAFTVGYALSPIDLIPDFIPVLGYLDDLVVVPLGIRYALRLVPREVIQKCRERARTEFREGSPKARKAAAVIIGVWLAILALVVVVIFRFLG